MAAFNRVVIAGNMTRDIDMRYTQSGTAVTDVSIAINEKVKRNNEWVEEVVYVDVTVWGKTAEIMAKYLGKGSSVLIEGRLKLDRWEADGQKRSKLKVVCEKMQMLGGGKGNGGGDGGGDGGGKSGKYSEPASTQAEDSPVDDSEIPF